MTVRRESKREKQKASRVLVPDPAAELAGRPTTSEAARRRSLKARKEGIFAKRKRR